MATDLALRSADLQEAVSPALLPLDVLDSSWVDYTSYISKLGESPQVADDPVLYSPEAVQGLYSQLWYLAVWQASQAADQARHVEPCAEPSAPEAPPAVVHPAQSLSQPRDDIDIQDHARTHAAAPGDTLTASSAPLASTDAAAVGKSPPGDASAEPQPAAGQSSAEPQALQQDAAAAAASEAQAAGFAHQQADILPHAQPQLHVPSPVTHAAQQATQLDDTRPQHASATACVDSATATDDPSAHASVKQTADEAHPMHIDEAIQQEATQQQAAAAEPADSADQHEADDRPDEQAAAYILAKTLPSTEHMSGEIQPAATQAAEAGGPSLIIANGVAAPADDTAAPATEPMQIDGSPAVPAANENGHAQAMAPGSDLQEDAPASSVEQPQTAQEVAPDAGLQLPAAAANGDRSTGADQRDDAQHVDGQLAKAEAHPVVAGEEAAEANGQLEEADGLATLLQSLFLPQNADETHALMHMLGLDELPDASDLLVALGRVHVSNHMAKEATNARLSKVSPKKRAAGDSGAAEIAPIRRPRRVPGGDPLDNEPFRRLIHMIRGNSTEFEAQGRVLRLKQYMPADANQAHIEAVLDALEVNDRVEALYIQNFEKGMRDEQLAHLVQVLRRKRIWALNVGENFNITLPAWEMFTCALTDTAVAYLYVSEHHIKGTNLKTDMRDAIRLNRKEAPHRDAEVIVRIKNMWFNPKLPTHLDRALLPDIAEEGAEQAPVRRRLWGRQDSLWNAQGAKDPAKRPLSPLGHLALPQAKRHCPEPEPGEVSSLDELAAWARERAAQSNPWTLRANPSADPEPQVATSGNPSGDHGADPSQDPEADCFRRAGSEPPPLSSSFAQPSGEEQQARGMVWQLRRSNSLQDMRIISEVATPLSSAYAQLRTMAPSPLKSPRPTPRWAPETLKARQDVRKPRASVQSGPWRSPPNQASSPALSKSPLQTNNTPTRRQVSRRPRQLAFTETEAGRLVKSPKRKLADTIAQRNGMPSLPEMISLGVISAGQMTLVVKGKSHSVYLFPDGTLTCEGVGYASLSSFSLAAMRQVTPGRQSSCGWWDVTYQGNKFGRLREQAAERLGVPIKASSRSRYAGGTK